MTPLALAALIFGCNPSETETTEPPAPTEVAPAPVPAEPARPTVDEVDWDAALQKPKLADVKAPDSFRVKFETTKGDFVVEASRAWAPNGTDRFYNLVLAKYFTDVAFFRTIPKFMGQFGLHGDPSVNRAWRAANIKDEPVVESNTRGMVTFAMSGQPNSRTTQLFINFTDNSWLDQKGFAPFGKVVEGMDVVDSLHMTGEGAPAGKGPVQAQIQFRGNEYLKKDFPEIDYIKSATVIE
ncbi:MAG: peptidylprolyl isomerase [Myxococcota bacterium]